MNPNLLNASVTGNVQLLNGLLEVDKLILDRIPVSCCIQTPLHIAALRGHLDFVKILVLKKPSFAMSLDSLRKPALHVASAAGHVEIVCHLLTVMTPEGWRLNDQDGRTPLHLAAMNERLEVIKVLIRKMPDLGRDLQENGETVLHTCISCNRFEALKLLAEVWNDEELATLTDCNGNTLLHLAVAQKQIQTVEYLLQKQSIRETGNTINGHGFTVLDVLDHGPKDLKALQIRNVLMEANFLRAKHHSDHFGPFQRFIPGHESSEIQKGWRSGVWNGYLNRKGDWLEKQRGILVLATIVIATTSFNSGLHPTGGTFTGSNDGPLGNAVQTKITMGHFESFLIQNTIIMVISLMISLGLLSGIPLKNKFCLWVLNLATLYFVVYMTATYLSEISTMSPDGWVNPTTFLVCGIWLLLLLLFVFIHTVFFVIWVIKKLLKLRRKRRNRDYVVV